MSHERDALNARITEELLFDLPQVKTQAALILGCRSVSGYMARAAVKQYHDGQFEQIIVSGGLRAFQVLPPKYYFNLMADGFGPGALAQKEAHLIRKILREGGVPDEAVIATDDKSANTGQNITNVAEALKSVRSVNIITLPYHQRRAIGTLRRHFGPEAMTATTTPVYVFGLTKDNWAQSALAGIVRGEFEKVRDDQADPKKSYVAQGFCTPVDLDAERALLRAAARPKPQRQPVP